VSATEASGVKEGALSRLEKIAKIISMQAHVDIAEQMGFNTIQLRKQETHVRIVGDWQEELMKDYGIPYEKGRVLITPELLDVNFDVIPHDGTVANTGDVNTWSTVFQTVSKDPALSQQLDTVRIFQHIAKLMGAKNIRDFIKKGGNIVPQVVPDTDIAAGVQAGNLVPTSEMPVPTQ
jgi:hypothetical protein